MKIISINTETHNVTMEYTNDEELIKLLSFSTKLNVDEPTDLDEDGNKSWLNEAGQLHRNNDLPAIIGANGTQYWYQNGKLIKSS
jgi:hypothetical protein